MDWKAWFDAMGIPTGDPQIRSDAEEMRYQAYKARLMEELGVQVSEDALSLWRATKIVPLVDRTPKGEG